MIPFRVAMALQADGWYLRSVIPWVKRNAMPESVVDRPTNSVEYIFMLTKAARPFYDVDAVRTPSAYAGRAKDTPGTRGGQAASAIRRGRDSSGGVGYAPGGRSLRNADWFFASLRAILEDKAQMLLAGDAGNPLALTVNPRPFKGAHFAVFPPTLVEPCIRASTSARGVCTSCGAPWARLRGRRCTCGRWIPRQGKACPTCGDVRDWKSARNIHEHFGETDWSTPGRGTPRKEGSMGMAKTEIGSWAPSCSCDFHVDCEPVTAPALVIDPFMGSGTTAVTARDLGRSYYGLELFEDFRQMAEARLRGR